jgi:hypothetical protein
MTDTLPHNATGSNVTSYTSKTTTFNQDDLTTSVTGVDDPYRLDKMAFARLRPSLQPPLKPGERVVICDGEFKGRFDSMR